MDETNKLRQILAANLRRHLEARFPVAPNLLTAFEELTGISRETTRRILVAQNAANIDTLEKFADALGIPAYTLLMPPKVRL